MIKKSLTGLWRSAAFFIITVAILVSIARFALPELERWRPELERSLSKKLAADVSVGSIDASWRGFGPQFNLNNLSIRTHTQQGKIAREVLHIGRAHAALDIVRSLLAWRPVMREFQVDGLRAAVELDSQGRLQLPGLDLGNSDASVSPDYVIDVLLRQNTVAINDSQIQYRRRRGDVIALKIPSLQLRNYADMHQASGDLQVENGGGAVFVLEFSAYPLAEKDQMSLYLASDALDLARLPFSTQDLGMQLNEGRLELKLWTHWQGGVWHNGESRFALHDVLFSNAKKQKRKLDTFSGHVWFERHKDQQWRWHGDELSYAVDGQHWPAMAMQGLVTTDAVYANGVDRFTQIVEGQSADTSTLAATTFSTETGAQSWSFDFSPLSLSQINDWLMFSDAVPVTVQNQLKRLQPQAAVPLLQFDGRWHSERLSEWALSAQVEDLVYNASTEQEADAEKNVSAQHLSARVLVGNQLNATNTLLPASTGTDAPPLLRGAARIMGRNTELILPDLFRSALPVDALDIALNWQQNAHAIELNLPHLFWRNADLSVWSRARVDIPLAEAGAVAASPQLSLTSYLEAADIAAKSRYLPTGIMSAELTRYLDEAAHSGRVASAWGLVRGPLAAFPFAAFPVVKGHAAQGVFAVHGDIDSARFKFQPDWPAAEQIDAQLTIDGTALALEVSELQWQQLKLKNVFAGIDNMLHAPTLSVRTQGVFDAKQTQQALTRTPLKASLAAVLDNLSVQGPLRTRLDIRLPLNEPEQLALNGELHLLDNEIAIVPADLNLAQVTGRVQFDQNGLTDGAIAATTLGGAIQTTVQNSAEQTAIIFNGAATAPALAQWLPHPLEDLSAGQIHYDGELLLPKGEHGIDAGLSLSVRTDLQDFALHLPPPLGKTDRELRLTDLMLQIQPEQLALRVNYGEELSAIAFKSNHGDWRAELLIGARDYVGDRDGISVRAELPALNAQEWLAPIQKMVERAKKNAQMAAGNAASFVAVDNAVESTVESALDSALDSADLQSSPRIDLQIGALNAFGLPFSNVHMAGIAIAQGYRLQIEAEKVAGTVAILENQPLQVLLQYLEHELAQSAPLGVEAPLPVLPALLDLHAEDFPEVDFTCQRCRLLSRDLGQLDVQVRGDNAARDFNITATRSSEKRERLLAAKLQGRWQEGMPSHFTGKINSDSFADLLRDWRIDLGMKDSAGRADIDLSWPGSPFDFNLQAVQGTLKLDWGKGYITSVSDAQARVFSLLSLQSLTRRLSLDFSDLYKDGFFYDGIKGEFSFNNGVAHTDSIFVKGVAADATLMGDADLLRQTLHHRVIVEPQLSASLPILAGWIINPGVGLLTWLANKLFFEDAVSVVTKLEYSIDGPMDHPAVNEIKRSAKEVPVPDTGSPVAGATTVPATAPVPATSPIPTQIPVPVP